MPSSSYYRVIHGVKYDDRILKAAEAVAQQPCHDKSLAIDRERALPIVAAATDGKSVTAVERRKVSVKASLVSPAVGDGQPEVVHCVAEGLFVVKK